MKHASISKALKQGMLDERALRQVLLYGALVRLKSNRLFYRPAPAPTMSENNI